MPYLIKAKSEIPMEARSEIGLDEVIYTKLLCTSLDRVNGRPFKFVDARALGKIRVERVQQVNR